MPRGTEKILMEIYEKLGKLEGTVKTGFNETNKRLDRMNGSLASHDRRINDLENTVGVIKGKWTVLGAIGGGIMAIITTLIIKKIGL